MERHNVKVDVILVTYNQSLYVLQAIESVLTQCVDEHIKVRVIVADDCSIDNTLEITKSCEKKSPFQFVYLNDEKNLGIAENYRRAFKNIDADYFAILEGDDYWIDPYKLQKQINYLESHPEVGICSTDCLIEVDGIKSKTGVIASTSYKINQTNPLFENQYLANLTWMFRKDILQYINIPKECVDIPLLLLYETCLHSRIEYLNDITGVFRRHDGSVTNMNYLSYGKYYYDKNLFKLRISYADRFTNSILSKRILYTDALLNLYPLAKLHDDDEICNIIKEYFIDQIDFKTYDSYANNKIDEFKRFQSLLKSKAYRLGKLILRPFSFIKNIR